MSIKVTVEGAQQVERGIWRAEISPADVRILREWSGETESNLPLEGGERSLVLVQDPAFRGAEQRLDFDPHLARTLILGTTQETLIIDTLVQGTSPP